MFQCPCLTAAVLDSRVSPDALLKSLSRGFFHYSFFHLTTKKARKFVSWKTVPTRTNHVSIYVCGLIWPTVFINRKFWQAPIMAFRVDWLVYMFHFPLASILFKNIPHSLKKWPWLHFLKLSFRSSLSAALLSTSTTDTRSFYCPSVQKNAVFGASVSYQRSSLKIPQEEQIASGNKAPLEIHFQTLFWITQPPHNLGINATDKTMQFIQGIQKQKLENGLFS